MHVRVFVTDMEFFFANFIYFIFFLRFIERAKCKAAYIDRERSEKGREQPSNDIYFHYGFN